jgi:hypothetical protein
MMWAGAILRPTATIFGVSKDPWDVINSAKFHLNRYGRLGLTGGRNLHVAIEQVNDPYHTAKHYAISLASDHMAMR